VHSGQIVAAQVALAAMLAGGGRPGTLAAGAGLLFAAFARVRGQWLYRWVRAAAGLAVRRRRTAAGADPVAGLAVPRPGVRPVEVPLERPAAGLTDAYGTVVVLELDGAAAAPATPVVVPAMPELPVQLLVSAVPARSGTDPVALSYRELAGGGGTTARQVLLGVRVGAGDDPGPLVREVRRRLAPQQSGPVAPGELAEVVAGLGCVPPVHETWSCLHAGGLRHVTYQVDTSGVSLSDLVAGWLAVPGPVATTVSVSGAGVAARLAVDPAQRAPAAAPPSGHHLGGDQLPGFAATLPLGVGPPYRPPRAGGRRGAGGPPEAVRLEPAGLVLGRDEKGVPVRAALFGRRGVRVVLVGDGDGARLLAWRAVGAGARVVVRTANPAAWEPLIGITPARWLSVMPPDAAGPVAGEPHRPVLAIVETAGGGIPPAAGRWCAEVLIRPRVGADEVGLLARAGLVLCRRLREPEATVVSAALGLGSAGAGLRRSGDRPALAAISQGAVEWVRPSLTAAERDLFGPDPFAPRGQ
jgi:type VII secretion protein EccE